MKRALASYAAFTIIVAFLICLDLTNYKDFKRLNTQYNLLSKKKQEEIDKNRQMELEKNKELKRKYGYSDILSFSSSSDGMKIITVENNEGERPNTKVSFKYKGNNSGFLDILSSLQKQENLIGVSSIKITHNKEEEGISGNINATFINNK